MDHNAFSAAMPRRRLFGSASALVALAGLPRWAAAADTPTDAVWASSFKDLTDTVQPLSQYKGKTAVIYFFATWCVPCHLETPKLVKLYEYLLNPGK